jgi:exodeoxyribonuclease VII small subunit
VLKTSKSGAVSGVKSEELPFEEALEKLEAIVDAMESDELPLESLLARFEEGTRLARQCQARLAEAELKIQQLEKQPDGALTLKPLAVADPGAES